MSAPKAGSYVLVSSAFYRVEGEGDEAVRRRYKRGDRVELSKAEAARLAVPSPLAAAAFIKAGDAPEDLVGDDLVTSPPLVVNRESQANQLVAEANTNVGLAPVAEPVVLTEEQVASEVTTPAVTGAGAGDLVPTTETGAPAKSATLEAWQAHAVKVGAVSEAESGDLTKAKLQEAVARKAAAGD